MCVCVCVGGGGGGGSDDFIKNKFFQSFIFENLCKKCNIMFFPFLSDFFRKWNAAHHNGTYH